MRNGSRVAVCPVVSGLLTMIYVALLIRYPDLSFSFSKTLTSPETKIIDQNVRSQADCENLIKQDFRNETSINKQINDYLTESDVALDNIVTDITEAASIEKSTVQIMKKSSMFTIGEDVWVSVVLRNGYGEKLNRRPGGIGGDKLHIRLFNTTTQSFVAGRVIDHQNGSYTAVVRAVSPGRQTVSVTLPYPREVIKALYASRNEHPGNNVFSALFESGTTQEETSCQPKQEWLPQYKDVCNLTMQNGGMSWYCGKPTNTTLLCEDWSKVKARLQTRIGPSDNIVNKLMSTERRFPDITILVTGSMKDSENLPICSSLPKRYSWTQCQPVGFFYNGKWSSYNCRSKIKIPHCLKDKRLFLFGDSTIRQWYKLLLKEFACESLTEEWTKEKWHKRSICSAKNINLTIEWLPHAQPFSVGKIWYPKKYSTHPIATVINELPDNNNTVLVIHMYGHLLYWHHSIFRDRIRAISRSIEHFLRRNSLAKVLIKAPHTFTQSPASYYSYVYRDILREEFTNLYDKVIYIDQADMTIAKENSELHPPPDISKEAVLQLLGYICE